MRGTTSSEIFFKKTNQIDIFKQLLNINKYLNAITNPQNKTNTIKNIICTIKKKNDNL